MSDLQRRLEVVADWANQESRHILDRVHKGDPLTFAEMTDMAYGLQGLATFCRATGIEPQSVDVSGQWRRLRVVK